MAYSTRKPKLLVDRIKKGAFIPMVVPSLYYEHNFWVVLLFQFLYYGFSSKNITKNKNKNSGMALKSPSRTQTHTVPSFSRLCTAPPQGTGQPPKTTRGHWGLLSHKILVVKTYSQQKSAIARFCRYNIQLRSCVIKIFRSILTNFTRWCAIPIEY